MGRDDQADDRPPRSGGPGPGAKIRAELAPGEQILWLGGPTPGRAAAASAGPAIVGAILVLFALGNALQAAVARPDPARKRLPAGVVALIGLAGSALCLAPVWSYRRARRTAYALTDRRGVILETRPRGGCAIRSYDPDRLRSLARRDSPFGGPAGDLTFEARSRTARRGFLHLEDAAAVEALIRSTLLAGQEPAGRDEPAGGQA